MSAPDERTPLIRNVHHDDPAQQRDQQSSTDIKAQSRSILLSLQNEDVVILDIGAGPVDFLVLLYATRCLCDFLHEGFTSGNDSISSSVARERQESNIRHRIDQEVIKILDVWGHGAVDDVSLYEALWTRWDIDERGVSGESFKTGRKVVVLINEPLISWFYRRTDHRNLVAYHIRSSRILFGTCTLTVRFLTGSLDSKGQLVLLKAPLLPGTSYLLRLLQGKS